MFRRALSNEIVFWRALTILLGVFAYLKGARLPTLYIATEAQLNYDHGLVKRGLFGAFWKAFHVPIHHYAVFAVVSYGLLAVLIVALILFIRRAHLFADEVNVLACAVFFSSYAFTYIGHLVGRMDILLMTATLLVLTIENPWRRNAVLLVVGPLCVLLHEMFVLTFLPLCVLPSVLNALEKRRLKDGALEALLFAVPVAATWVATFALAWLPAISGDQAAQIQADIVGRIDFPVGSHPWKLIRQSAVMTLALMLGWALPAYNPIAWFISAFIFLPPIIFLTLLACNMLRASNDPHPRWGAAAIVATIAVPALMNVLGTDLHRWHTFCVFNAFGAVGIVMMRSRSRTRATSPHWRNGAILVIALNLLAGGALMDYYKDAPYPYHDHIESGFKALHERHLPAPH